MNRLVYLVKHFRTWGFHQRSSLEHPVNEWLKTNQTCCTITYSIAFPITATLRRNFLLTGYVLVELNWFCNLNVIFILEANKSVFGRNYNSFILVELLFAKTNPTFFMSWGTCRLTYYAFENMLFLAGYIFDAIFKLIATLNLRLRQTKALSV